MTVTSERAGSARTRNILRDLIVLSLPTILEQICSTLLQYVDTAMVGRLGENATAAVSTTTSVNWLVGSVPFAIGISALAIASRENGAGNEAAVRKVTGMMSRLVVIGGLAMMVLCLALSPFIPVWMGAAQHIRADATAYFAIISIPMIPRFATYVFGSCMQAVKDTRTPMAINLSANILNAILNAALIYGLCMGVRGAAIATAISYTAAGCAMFAAARRKRALRYAREEFRIAPDLWAECRKISLPTLGNSAASHLGYVIFAGLVSGMGTTIFAAHSIAVTAETLFYVPGFGLRTATSSLIGNAMGEGDIEKVKSTEQVSIVITVLVMILSGVLLYAVSEPLMRVFTSSEQAALLGARMLRMVAFTEPFFGLMIVLEGVFYGMGRTRGVFFVETGCMYGIRIFFTTLVTKVWHLDLQAVWTCMIADNIAKSLLLFLLYRRMVRERSRGVAVKNR